MEPCRRIARADGFGDSEPVPRRGVRRGVARPRRTMSGGGGCLSCPVPSVAVERIHALRQGQSESKATRKDGRNRVQHRRNAAQVIPRSAVVYADRDRVPFELTTSHRSSRGALTTNPMWAVESGHARRGPLLKGVTTSHALVSRYR